MLRVVRVLAIAAAICLIAAAVTHGDGRRRSCDTGTPRTSVVVASPAVLVYRRVFPDADETVYHACLLATGRVTPVGSAYDPGEDIGGPGSVADGRGVTVNGHIVGFFRQRCFHTAGCSMVARAFDARTGEATGRIAIDRLGGPDRMVVTSSGRVVITYVDQVTTYASGPNETSVSVVTSRRGGSTVLDSGAGIDSGSLAVVGRRIFWLKDGRPSTALLSG